MAWLLGGSPDSLRVMGPNRRAQEQERAAARAKAEAARAEAERKAIAEVEKIVAIWNARQADHRGRHCGRVALAKLLLPGLRPMGRGRLAYARSASESVNLKPNPVRLLPTVLAERAVRAARGADVGATVVLGFRAQGGWMKRRAFIAGLGSATAWPMVARAQQPERMRRIGVLISISANDPDAQTRLAAFVQNLQQLGWSEGRNVQIDYRWGGGEADRTRRYAAELIALGPSSSAVVVP